MPPKYNCDYFYFQLGDNGLQDKEFFSCVKDFTHINAKFVIFYLPIFMQTSEYWISGYVMIHVYIVHILKFLMISSEPQLKHVDPYLSKLGKWKSHVGKLRLN